VFFLRIRRSRANHEARANQPLRVLAQIESTRRIPSEMSLKARVLGRNRHRRYQCIKKAEPNYFIKTASSVRFIC
jgi:hypothetical protein